MLTSASLHHFSLPGFEIWDKISQIDKIDFPDNDFPDKIEIWDNLKRRDLKQRFLDGYSWGGGQSTKTFPAAGMATLSAEALKCCMGNLFSKDICQEEA